MVDNTDMTPGKKILIIDDNKELVQELEGLLKAYGFEVEHAFDGQLGLDVMDKVKPNLVIVDLAMPKMTGNIVVRILKGSPKHKDIPIIMLSAFVDPEMKNGVEVPADEYLSKPFRDEELIGAMNRLLKIEGN